MVCVCARARAQLRWIALSWSDRPSARRLQARAAFDFDSRSRANTMPESSNKRNALQHAHAEHMPEIPVRAGGHRKRAGNSNKGFPSGALGGSCLLSSFQLLLRDRRREKREMLHDSPGKGADGQMLNLRTDPSQ